MQNKQINSVITSFLTVFVVFLGCENTGMESPIGVDNLSFDGGSSYFLSKNESTHMSGSALSFDGDDYVIIPDDPSLDMTEGFTIAAWIYLESYSEWASIVTKGDDDSSGGPHGMGFNNYTIHQSGESAGSEEFGHLRFTHEEVTSFRDSDTKIPLQEWRYVAVTFDGSILKFYLDGNPDGEHALEGPLPTNDKPLYIGVDFPGGDEYWFGMIDELRIWNKPLKEVHIRAAMHGHATPMASALVGYWRFDESSGDIAHDRSRYHNHGTLIGNPIWFSPGAPNK